MKYVSNLVLQIHSLKNYKSQLYLKLKTRTAAWQAMVSCRIICWLCGDLRLVVKHIVVDMNIWHTNNGGWRNNAYDATCSQSYLGMLRFYLIYSFHVSYEKNMQIKPDSYFNWINYLLKIQTRVHQMCWVIKCWNPR